MSKPNFIKTLAGQLSEALPSHFNSFKNDFNKNCSSILNQAFAKLDLVTREEFDAQTKVLLRTRKKLTELEKQIEQLEMQLKAKGSHRK